MSKINKISETICVYPWIHVAVRSNGVFRPCCVSEKNFVIDNTAKKLSIYNSSIEEFRNSYFLRNMRKEMISGLKPETCKRCWKEEEANVKSLRLQILENYKLWSNVNLEEAITYSQNNDGYVNVDLNSIDLKLGNLCNLKCRMCTPNASFKFLSNMNEVNSIDHLKVYNKNSQFTWFKDQPFKETLIDLLPSIKRLQVSGGEPTINKQLLDILSICVERGYSKNIRIHMITNLTNINERLLTLLEKFDYMSIALSMDGIYEMNDFIRYPSKWDTIQKNLFKMLKFASKHKRIVLHINLTYQMYNILDIVRITKWFKQLIDYYSGIIRIEINYICVHFPWYFSVKTLPEDLKEVVKKRVHNYQKDLDDQKLSKQLTAIVDYMYLEQYPFDEFVRVTNIFNKERNQNINALDPLLVEKIENYV